MKWWVVLELVSISRLGFYDRPAGETPLNLDLTVQCTSTASLLERLTRGTHHGVSCDVEFLVDVRDLSRRAKFVHPDKASVQAKITVPRHFDGSS
jgi:hypothetical protein